jgi:hypothetical protein
VAAFISVYHQRLMNKGVLFAVAAGGAITILAAIFVIGGRGPEPAADAPSAAAPAPRIVPKKTDAAPAAPEPAKAAPKKAEPKPAEPAPAAPTLATLTLESDVPGASVFIDRQFVGNTPLTLDRLEPGAKQVQLTATGFESIQRRIELVPGANNITLRIKEVSLDAKTPVVHKHGMGSCDGTLVATLDGLRYESSNKADAFTLPYAQVETFVVDYLEKNLRVKQRGGKTWNFTDKNENADALFVFHRDVEAARKKLAAGYGRGQ